jgi:hypothetical protein
MVAVAAGYGLWLAGSPAAERSKRIDTQRVSDLQNIASFVDSYYARYGKIPASFDDMQGKNAADSFALGRLVDPVTKEPYEYAALSEGSYELCAVFDAESEEVKPGYPTTYPYYGKEWEHGSGRHCFTIDATLRQPRSACSLTSPCAAGQSCVTLGDGQGPVCVPAGKECLAADCANGCAVAESYPAQVRCTE